jgi:hypothetical protein
MANYKSHRPAPKTTRNRGDSKRALRFQEPQNAEQILIQNRPPI